MTTPQSQQSLVQIKKADTYKHLVYGEVYVPNIPDSHGDVMDVEGIERMAHNFMRQQRTGQVDVQHDNDVEQGCMVVESFIVRPGDADFTEGAWVVCVHVDNPDLWEKILNHEINGFSMEAWVTRSDVMVTVEIPSSLTGTTDEVDGHSHTFEVVYSEGGEFLGGSTTVSEGHYHSIVHATHTEEASGHSHRFAYLDQIEATITKCPN